TRWLLAAWHAHRRDTLRLKGLRDAVLADTQSTPLPLRAAFDGHLALAHADTENAVNHFRTLRVNVSAEALEWGLAEPLALERLVLAGFALARGNFAEAHRIGAVFDHPAPIAYLPYLPASLQIRLRAAEGMGRPDLVARYQIRLRRLQALRGIALGH
ncbi:MAG TPA: hypothetical protein VFU40_07375, partial [Gemmatimonadales bacterium]|nr:hypothetical protein [Gemmatimonadales bacterium]